MFSRGFCQKLVVQVVSRSNQAKISVCPKHFVSAFACPFKTSSCGISTQLFTRSLSSFTGEPITGNSKISLSEHNDIVEEIMPELTKLIEEKSKFHVPNLKYVEGLIKILVSFKFKMSEIIDCLTEKHDELNKLGHETLVDKIGYLRANGFHPNEVALLLKTSPQVLKIKKETIKESLLAYMGIGVPDGRIQLLFAREPSLFLLTKDEIHQKVISLGKYFSRKEIIEIASKHPHAFLDSFEDIEEKFKYVTDVMGLEVKHLMRFEVFEHSLLHMKTRHRLLHKAGLYQTPDKLGTTEIENPSITRIMDTTDKVFAHQVAGLTVDELEAFKKMEELESLLESLEEDTESDESDDDDNAETDYDDRSNHRTISEQDRTTLQRLSKYKRDKWT